MVSKVLEKYLVGVPKKEIAKKGSFLSHAKKHIIPAKGKKKEDLAQNIDKILYGK